MKVCDLPGHGPTSQTMLAVAGIDSIEMLKRLGSVQAYVMVKRAGCAPSLNLLWGLESAVTDCLGKKSREVIAPAYCSLSKHLNQRPKASMA
jgi:hypothetical protein